MIVCLSVIIYVEIKYNEYFKQTFLLLQKCECVCKYKQNSNVCLVCLAITITSHHVFPINQTNNVNDLTRKMFAL